MREIDRIRNYYHLRDSKGSPYQGANAWLEIYRRSLREDLFHLLRQHNLFPLSALKVLEIGCGTGAILQLLLELGASSSNLHGADISSERIEIARKEIPAADFILANAECLPHEDSSFDIVLAFTIFSSVLDARTRRNIAEEIERILRFGAVLIWYDFIWNPLNRSTRGIGKGEIESLFPSFECELKKVTLAPPIGRQASKHSPTLFHLLEMLPFLRSHYLGLLRKCH